MNQELQMNCFTFPDTDGYVKLSYEFEQKIIRDFKAKKATLPYETSLSDDEIIESIQKILAQPDAKYWAQSGFIHMRSDTICYTDDSTLGYIALEYEQEFNMYEIRVMDFVNNYQKVQQMMQNLFDQIKKE